jgi:hypothetical protein
LAYPLEISSPTPPLTPQESVLPPGSSPAELAARFAEASADEIEALWQDIRAEDAKLRKFIQGDGRLDEWAGEVERLIKEGEERDEADEAEDLVEE